MIRSAAPGRSALAAPGGQFVASDGECSVGDGKDDKRRVQRARLLSATRWAAHFSCRLPDGGLFAICDAKIQKFASIAPPTAAARKGLSQRPPPCKAAEAQKAVVADRIRVIAYGRHDALTARRGPYCHLHQTQVARETSVASAAG
jgi:hypothetical protein